MKLSVCSWYLQLVIAAIVDWANIFLIVSALNIEIFSNEGIETPVFDVKYHHYISY